MPFGGHFSVEILYEQQALIIFSVEGKNAIHAFHNEAGVHRIQRVPPTEKRGRTHTSTITVSVLPIPKESDIKIKEDDIEFKFCRGSGSGGQHRNVTDSAVQLLHLPTGIMIRVENERSQTQNKKAAMELLRAKLQMSSNSSVKSEINNKRKEQIGNATRNEKIRTVAIQRDQVVHHPNDKRMSSKDYFKGYLEQLWN